MGADVYIRPPEDAGLPGPEVARLASSSQVRYAVRWFRDHEPRLASWQVELARIPAPPFGETARAAWLQQQFAELGLQDVHRDEVGNVLGIHPGLASQCVSVSAHMDTVFPAGAPLCIQQEGSRLTGPGVSDNGAGLAALLAMAAVLRDCDISHVLPILFVANVGEEGEGDLRGMRYLFSNPRWQSSIAYSLVLDGAGCDTIVAQGLGSRRFEVTVRGPGGHSWSDFGASNPIVILSQVIHEFAATPLPAVPKTTFNVGVVQGGTSVNSIPESASMRVDIRSGSPDEIQRLETQLRLAIERAVEAGKHGKGPSGVTYEMVKIGDRPAGELGPQARILRTIREVDVLLGNTATVQRASTDANIPLSLGREAIAIGGGGTGGGAHTLQEWFDCKGRELGLRRILLTLLTLATLAE